MSTQNTSTKKQWYRKWWGIALIVILGLSALSAATRSSQTSEKAQPPQQPSTQSGINYVNPEKKITNTETVDTKYIVVTGYLLNNTDKAGMADCNVEFYDREMNWAGGKGLGGQTLESGQRYDFTVQVEVDHTGLVSKQGINCEQ